MKNCDAHGALFYSNKALAQGEGYLINADYIKRSSIYEKFLEQNRAEVEGLGLTMAQYRAQMDSIQGNTPWMLCEDCIKELQLSAADLERAHQAAIAWDTDHSTAGIIPGQAAKRTAAKPKAKSVDTTAKKIVDALLLGVVFFVHVLNLLPLLFTQSTALIAISSIVTNAFFFLSLLILVKRKWLLTFLYVIGTHILLFIINMILIAIAETQLRDLFFLYPFVSMLEVIALVWIGKKILKDRASALSYPAILVLSLIILIIDAVLVTINGMFFEFYPLGFSIDLFIAWPLVLFIYAGIKRSASAPRPQPGSYTPRSGTDTPPVSFTPPNLNRQDGPGMIRADDARKIMESMLNMNDED